MDVVTQDGRVDIGADGVDVVDHEMQANWGRISSRR
jgi:hypothetical protein